MAKLAKSNPGLMPIVPDLAVEVLSPNDTALQVATKLNEYRAAGFPLIWIVDPEARSLAIYPKAGRATLLTEDADEVRAESVLPGFVCKLADLFPSPVPSADARPEPN